MQREVVEVEYHSCKSRTTGLIDLVQSSLFSYKHMLYMLCIFYCLHFEGLLGKALFVLALINYCKTVIFYPKLIFERSRSPVSGSLVTNLTILHFLVLQRRRRKRRIWGHAEFHEGCTRQHRLGTSNYCCHSMHFFFLSIGREPTTWPANSCRQINVCSCVVPSKRVLL